MARPELGAKHVCVSCAARFYDLGKSPAVCPKCGTEQPPEQPRLRRPPGPAAEEKRLVKKPAGVVGAEDADAEVEGVADEADADVIEDTDDLEDDADAIGPDIEVATDRDEAER